MSALTLMSTVDSPPDGRTRPQDDSQAILLSALMGVKEQPGRSAIR